jgi:RimJ/RimL family protein N-acetyltransferase
MEHPEFDIRFSEFDDLAYLSSWLSMPEGCDPFPFSMDEKEEALRNWMGFSKYKSSLTGLWNGVPCAVGTLFLMPYLKVAHRCSFYLVVDPDYRRKGIGTAMVRNLMHLGKNRFRLDSLHAELFLPSPLESVLDRLGFQSFAKQEGFVKIDPEHVRSRILMERNLHE